MYHCALLTGLLLKFQKNIKLYRLSIIMHRFADEIAAVRSNTNTKEAPSSPAPRAVPLQVSNAFLALCQIAFAANDPQFVLVGGGQVDGPRGDGRAKVARVRNIQVCI